MKKLKLNNYYVVFRPHIHELWTPVQSWFVHYIHIKKL